VRRARWTIVCLLAAAACGQETEPSESGGLALDIQTGSASALALDAGRVHLEGPTPKTVDVAPGDSVRFTELQPGSYTVSLEGLVGGEVERFGRVSGVQVTAGKVARPTINFDSFRPTINSVGLNATGTALTIGFAPLPGVTQYEVKVDHLADFSTAVFDTVSGTSAEFVLDGNPAKFVVVRATDPFGVPGRASDTLEAQVAVVGSDPGLDGWVDNGGNAVSSGGGPLVGDLDQSTNGFTFRQFFSFEYSSAPILSTVDAAVLRLYQATGAGTPFTVLGNVVVDHLDYSLSGLDPGDYTAPADAGESGLGPLSSDGAVGYRTLVVTNQLREDVTLGRPRSQYRLRFSTQDSNFDGLNDYVQFTDAEDSCCSAGSLPELVFVTHLTGAAP
jgi:hypothetical protein